VILVTALFKTRTVLGRLNMETELHHSAFADAVCSFLCYVVLCRYRTCVCRCQVPGIQMSEGYVPNLWKLVKKTLHAIISLWLRS